MLNTLDILGISDLLEDIIEILKNSVVNGVRSLCATLCKIIYPLIGDVYNLFMDVAGLRILPNDVLEGIYSRITMFLTIIMLFYISFEFIKYIVEPDSMSDKEKGVSKIGIKLIAVVVLIAFVPKIFTLGYDVQDAILKNEIIPQIVLQKKGTANNKIQYKNIGRDFSVRMFSMFYYLEYGADKTSILCDGFICKDLVSANLNSLSEYGTLPYLTLGLDTKFEKATGIPALDESNASATTNAIHFDEFLSLTVGILVLYMLILYCIDIGTRAVQLVYLQIISPIPIIGILSPKKDGIFGKWCKQVIATYLDVFLRLFLLNFIILICTLLLSSNGLNSNLESSETFVKIVLILGLLAFAKKVPELLKELMPKGTVASGNLSLKAGDRNLGRVAGGVIGAAAGTLVGATTGFAQGLRKGKSLGPDAWRGRKLMSSIGGGIAGTARGAFGGFGRGLVNGTKKDSNDSLKNTLKNANIGVKKQYQSNKVFGNKAEAGYTLGKQIQDTVGGYLGHSRQENSEKRKEQFETTAKQRESQEKRKSEILERAVSKAVKEGKYYESKSLATAATNYKALDQRKKDLENPSSDVRQQFRIGGEKQDTKSQERIKEFKNEANRSKILNTKKYNDVIKELSGEELGIKKVDFYNPKTKEFNQEAYEKAVETAYKERKDKIVDQELYEKLKTNGLLYANQDEADNALAIEQGKIGKAFAEAEDNLYVEYARAARQAKKDENGNFVGWNDNVIVYGDQREAQEEKIHNASADADHQINKESEINEILNNNEGMSYEKAELEWRKKYVSREKQREQLAASRESANLEKIKKEVASGNDGGKK